jgi:hypothetical protein
MGISATVVLIVGVSQIIPMEAQPTSLVNNWL